MTALVAAPKKMYPKSPNVAYRIMTVKTAMLRMVPDRSGRAADASKGRTRLWTQNPKAAIPQNSGSPVTSAALYVSSDLTPLVWNPYSSTTPMTRRTQMTARVDVGARTLSERSQERRIKTGQMRPIHSCMENRGMSEWRLSATKMA